MTPTATLLTLWLPETMTINVPVLPLLLGTIGLATMVSYAIHRQRVGRTYEARQRPRSGPLFLRYVRQWLGGHHDVVGHVRIRGR